MFSHMAISLPFPAGYKNPMKAEDCETFWRSFDGPGETDLQDLSFCNAFLTIYTDVMTGLQIGKREN